MKLNSFNEDGVTYYQLYICCPVCISKGVATPHSFVTHGDDSCHGDIYVGDNACCKCVKCGHLAHVKDCEFHFPCCHSASPDALVFFNGASKNEVLISIAGQLTDMAGIPWLQRFLENNLRFEISAERRGE